MKSVRFLLFSALAVLLSGIAPGLAQSIKPGTEIKVRLLNRLDTGIAKEGQTFSATLAEPVNLGNNKVLVRGTPIQGRVTRTVSSGRLKRPASITLTLTKVDKTIIQTEALQIDGESQALRNTSLVGGGAVSGSIVGAVAGGGKGSAIGTAVDAGGGSGTAYATGNEELVLTPETKLVFVVGDQSVTVTKTPEPVVDRKVDRNVDRNVERAPESRPVIGRGDSREDRDDAYDALILSDRDKWLIHSYFQSNYGNLPPGLAKRGGDLPPGLEKQLRRDEMMPAGLENRVEALPAELEHKLPGLPVGYFRVFISGRVIVLAPDNQIVDLMFIYR